MATPETMETIKLRGNQLIDQIKQLVHEGNVRRVNGPQPGACPTLSPTAHNWCVVLPPCS